MKKLLLTMFATFLFGGISYAKEFNSKIAGLSFSLTDDWNLSSEASTDKIGNTLTGERKKYIKSILEKTKVTNFEVLYNEKFVPDIITITKLSMPKNFVINKKNVRQNCRAIMQINEKNIGKKGKMYDCQFVKNRVSGKEGALYISHRDDISREKGEVRVNQIIFIINSQAVYFATSCKDFCKEVTGAIYAIRNTLSK
jgi:hypothetical protein